MVDVLAAPQQAKTDVSLRTLAAISTAHWVSHFHMFVLPMLFPFLKEQLGVGYMDFPGGCEGTMRAYYQLKVPEQIWAPNSHILSAYLNASVPYAAANGTNSGNVVYLHATSAISSATDWNNQPGPGTTVTSATFTTTSNFADMVDVLGTSGV